MNKLMSLFVVVLACGLLQTAWAASPANTPPATSAARTLKTELTCKDNGPDLTPTGWNKMDDKCIGAMKGQIQAEFSASMVYLSMAAHFAVDTVNRPGFAKLFFHSAAEEREHGTKLIEYLSMRGQLNEVKNLIPAQLFNGNWSPKDADKPGLSALKDALEREVLVTNSIRGVIDMCEEPKNKDKDNEVIPDGMNDYHLVDYLTGTYLEEQYAGQRDLAGKIATLQKLMKTHGAIGEFLFDKKLL